MPSRYSAEIQREAARKPSDVWDAMSRNAEKKADEAAASDLPWAFGNLRLYQGLAHKWGVYANAARAAEEEKAKC